MTSFFPRGLSRQSSELLKRCTDSAEAMSIETLQYRVDEHVEKAHRAAQHSVLVNRRLAKAIAQAIHRLCDDWDQVPSHAQPWLRGAMLYFIQTDDEESDFASPIGFEDDAEVLNACLRLADREDLCVDPEDHDDV